MTREILIVVFTLLCVFQINGQNWYERNPIFTTRVVRGDQDIAMKDADEMANGVILTI